MDTKTIFVLTSKGEEEVAHKTSLLYGDIKRALSMIDGVSTFAEISKRAAPSLRTILAELVKELLTGGFIQDKSRVGFSAKIVVPPKAAPATPVSAAPKQEQADSELDFTTIMRAPSADILRAEAAKVQAEMLAKQQAEQQKLKAEQEAAKAKQLADAENARKAAEHEARAKAVAAAEAKAKLEAEARAKQEAEARARKEAEEKARKEAEEKARKEAEEKARKEAEEKARKEAEEKARKEAEEKARKEAEEKARKEAEEKARKEAEEKARKEAEEKARKEAEEKARKEAEEKARKEAEEKARKEAEEKARKEAEEKARKEAEEKARKEAEEKARKEAEEKARKEAEEKARKEAESKARAQAEFARLKAEQEAEKVRKDAELAKQKAEAEAARFKAEAEAAKSREEAERIKKEAELAAAKAREEAERIKQEAEAAAAQAKAEAERIKQEAEAQAKALEEATRKAQAEAEAARLKAEEEAARVRAELEAARLKAKQEEIARAEAETARLAAEHIAAQALVAAEQKKLQELEKLAIQAREEEKIRAKQHALAAASTQVRDTPYDTSKPPAALKLDAIDLDALEIKPEHEQHTQAGKNKGAVTGPTVEELRAQEEALKAKEEALKQQAKKAEEARLAEEAAAKKLADAQAKAWAEAEQRAAQAAKAHVEHLAQQSAQSAQAKQQQEENLKATMNKRKPLPWGGIAVGLLVVAVVAVFIVPMTLNTRNYADNLEAQLSKELGQPVHIGKLSLRILPTPQVVLGEMYIGEIKQIKADKAQLDMSFGALFGSVKSVDRVEVQGGELNSNGLLSVPDWLEKMASDSGHPIHQIVFSGMKVTAEAVQFNDIDGTVDFAPTGKLEGAVLHAMGGKYTLELKAASQGKYAATFNVRKASLPLLPNWNFEDLTAKGELTRDGINVTEFDSRIAGGGLQGDAKLEWKNGWIASGSLNAKAVALASINKLLEGDMDGVGRFKMQADSLANLADSVYLDGSFATKKGMFSGVDIVETARLHSKDHLPGGRTYFDQMDGALTYSSNAFHFKSIKVTNSVMNATGSVDIAKQQLSGRLSARLSITEGTGPVDLQLGGATDNPNLRAIR